VKHFNLVVAPKQTDRWSKMKGGWWIGRGGAWRGTSVIQTEMGQ